MKLTQGFGSQLREQTEHDPLTFAGPCLSVAFWRRGLSRSLPSDFNWIGPAACERCEQLRSVDLSRTQVAEILGSTFAIFAPPLVFHDIGLTVDHTAEFLPSFDVNCELF